MSYDEAKLLALAWVDPLRCPGCHEEVDWETCWCGEAVKAHDMFSNHAFVPQGCECGRAQSGS